MFLVAKLLNVLQSERKDVDRQWISHDVGWVKERQRHRPTRNPSCTITQMENAKQEYVVGHRRCRSLTHPTKLPDLRLLCKMLSCLGTRVVHLVFADVNRVNLAGVQAHRLPSKAVDGL